MPKISNKIGQRFNRLVVVSKSDQTYRGRTIWVCKCDCGKITQAVGGNLTNKGKQSCGCLLRNNASLRGGRGRTVKHRMTWTRPWRIWVKMRNRCYNDKENNYPRYGGRGITVCDEWRNDFAKFWLDMKTTYSDELTLDRIDNNGNYCKENCKWSTPKEQAQNRRKRSVL